MIGSIISGVAQLGSTIYGAVKSGQYNRKVLDELQKREDENRRWYEMKSSQDYTQRSDVRNILNKQRELLDEQMKRSRATNVVSGGTDESLALQQAEANKSVSDTMSNIAAGATAYKEGVEDAYRSKADEISKERQSINAQQAQAVAGAAGQTAQALGRLADPMDEMIDAVRNKAKPTTSASKLQGMAAQATHDAAEAGREMSPINKKRA